MPQKNMNRSDRTVRIVLGLALIIVGLFLQNGAQGNLRGIIIATLGLLPLLAGVTGICPLDIPFGISTYQGDPDSMTFSQS